MYAALWRVLPGNRWAKAGQSLVLFLVVVALLFVVVFPAITPYLPFENVTIEPPPATPSPGATTP
ncbi:hypothetical protein [Lapillicoccus sp.]|uniref:hypothetical protein n=1 Tax=Lapillicoccus sp. TaxID=1909287 RepID=UPI0039832B63